MVGNIQFERVHSARDGSHSAVYFTYSSPPRPCHFPIRNQRYRNNVSSIASVEVSGGTMKSHLQYESSTTVHTSSTLTSPSADPATESRTYFNKSLPNTGGGPRREGCYRPPFITTVTKGKFLPSKFDLLVERNVFTFSSKPRPVPAAQKQSHSSPGIRLEHDARPRGVHDYFNLMWDPHVVRGSTIKVKAEYVTNNPPKTGSEDEPKRKKRSTYLAKKSRINPSPVANGNLYTKKNVQRESERRLHEMIQTERDFLEELPSEGSSTDVVIQTDKIYTAHVPFRPLPIKVGVDASTQILPGDLFDFDSEVEPILDAMLANILEHSLCEVIEEEELCTIREQRNRFEEERKSVEKAVEYLKGEKARITFEKERLEKELELELSSGPANGAGDSVYSSSAYFLELLPSVLNSLQQEGLLQEFVSKDNEVEQASEERLERLSNTEGEASEAQQSDSFRNSERGED